MRYDLILMWSLKEENKPKQAIKTETHRYRKTDWWLPEGKRLGGREGKMREGGPLYGDGWLLDFCW